MKKIEMCSKICISMTAFYLDSMNHEIKKDQLELGFIINYEQFLFQQVNRPLVVDCFCIVGLFCGINFCFHYLGVGKDFIHAVFNIMLQVSNH